MHRTPPYCDSHSPCGNGEVKRKEKILKLGKNLQEGNEGMMNRLKEEVHINKKEHTYMTGKLGESRG